MSDSTLQVLLKDIISIPQLKGTEISGLTLDSRMVKPGDLFFACQGTQLDGRQFIPDAIKKGACIILAEDAKESFSTIENIPVVSIPQLSQKVGLIASRFYQEPSKHLRMIGITGTNGKTSSAHLIASALHELNLTCGVLGTLGNGLYGNIQQASLTTPDAVTLQKTLAEFWQQGAQYTVMEVSSHSLDQGRVNGIHFDVGVYTNLTRDHLDYHGTMENYGNAKKKLFASAATQHAVINADDAFGMQIIQELHDKKNLYAYGMQQKLSSPVPLIYVDQVQLDLSGIRAQIYSPWGSGELAANLIGKFNLSNLMAVFTTLCVLDIPFTKVLQAMRQLKPVAGRMQTFGGTDNKPLAVVDYSHTPDALEKALTALRHHCQGKLYCVFGCGGDRDRGKRPMMAKIAEQFADYVIVTDDNPRTENAEQIFNDMKTGFAHPEKVIMQHDRAKAIHDTIRAAQPGDCVLIAGKGAETYQIIGNEKYPFQDGEQVRLGLQI